MAVVAAISEEIAEEALDLIRVEYAAAGRLHPEEAMQDGAPSIHGAEHNLVMPPFVVASGDVGAGCRSRFHLRGSLCHLAPRTAYMEPDVCICQFDAAGKLTVWISTQAPFIVRGSLSEVLGIPMSQIR